jgi:hypothetical protein
MKKILTVLLSSFFLFFVTSNVSAACNPVSNTGNCPRGQIECNLSGSIYCCDQAGGSCNQLQGSVQVEVATTNPTSTTNTPLCEGNGINTAIGCIPVLSGTNGFLTFILRWAVGIGGGIAFLLMVYAGFEIMTASGNPERMKAGQELLTSAISGLILLIFCVFILKFIGVDILGLCNFGFNVGSCPK